MVEPQREVLAPGEVVDPYVTALAQFDAAADYLGLDDSTRQYLRNNRRELIVHLPVRQPRKAAQSERSTSQRSSVLTMRLLESPIKAVRTDSP